MRNAVMLYRPHAGVPWSVWDNKLRTIRQVQKDVRFANARVKARGRRPMFRVGIVTVQKWRATE